MEGKVETWREEQEGEKEGNECEGGVDGGVGGKRGKRFECDLECLGVGGKSGNYSEDFGGVGEKVEWEGR